MALKRVEDKLRQDKALCELTERILQEQPGTTCEQAGQFQEGVFLRRSAKGKGMVRPLARAALCPGHTGDHGNAPVLPPLQSSESRSRREPVPPTPPATPATPAIDDHR